MEPRDQGGGDTGGVSASPVRSTRFEIIFCRVGKTFFVLPTPANDEHIETRGQNGRAHPLADPLPLVDLHEKQTFPEARL